MLLGFSLLLTYILYYYINIILRLMDRSHRPVEVYEQPLSIFPPSPEAATLVDALLAEEREPPRQPSLRIGGRWGDSVGRRTLAAESPTQSPEDLYRWDTLGGAEVLHRYAALQCRMDANVARIRTLCTQSGKEVSVHQIRWKILNRVYGKMSPIGRDLLPGNAAERFCKDDIGSYQSVFSHQELLRMQILSSLVPPRALAHLDVYKEEEFTPRSFHPARTLADEPALEAAVLTMVKKAFPGGDDAYFAPCFLPDPHAELHVLLCGNKENGVPVMMLGLEGGFPGGLRYATWLCANESANVRGMAIPFQRAVLERLRDGGTFQVCRPYASLPLALHLGSVCDALTAPGEFINKGYLHSRWLPEEQGKYPVRALGEKVIQRTLDAGSLAPGAVVERAIAGLPARVCRVEFPGAEHHTDIDQETHWFYRALADELAAGRVLTALIRAGDWHGGRQPYYAVFETDAAAPKRKEELRDARIGHRAKQSGFAAIAAAAAGTAV